MGLEFLDIFSGWADEYDQFVKGEDKEYKEVFAKYEAILDEIVSRSGEVVLEFGIGTGNLTKKLLDAGKTVVPVEPSEEMRLLAKEKLPQDLFIQSGDMQEFDCPAEKVDTIVSSYVFHHLTDEEKLSAMKVYATLLKENGKVVFADTVFFTKEMYAQIIEESKNLRYDELVEDLKREHYPTMDTIYSILKQSDLKEINLKQMNNFVWIFEGKRKQ